MSDIFVLPPRLRPGDRVAVIAPSGGLAAAFPHVYRLGLERLRAGFGLEPVEFPTALCDDAYLAAHPQARADDIHAAFADPSIRAVMATIGGDDQVKVLKHLDLDLLVRHPKIFTGFSDNTHLHNALWNSGVISYYGGALLVQFAMQGAMHDYTKQAIRMALFEDQVGEVFPSAEWTDYDLDWSDPANLDRRRPLEPNPGWVWHNAEGRHVVGRLWGGCLESLDFELRLGKYLPPPTALRDIVLYFETSEELPSADYVWRLLTCMGERGLLAACSAVLVGRPKTQCLGQHPPQGRAAYAEEQRRTIAAVLDEYAPDCLAVFGLDIGHTDPQLLVPNGGIAEIDGSARRIIFH